SSAGAASRVDPSSAPTRGALYTPAAAASCDADPPRMATHTVAATTAHPIAGGRLAVASAERVRDATELCEWAAACTRGCCTLGTTSSGGRQKRRRARLKALPRAPAQHFFPAGAETLPGCGHAGPDGAAARAPTLLARSSLRGRGEDNQHQRRCQPGRRSHPNNLAHARRLVVNLSDHEACLQSGEGLNATDSHR